MSFSLAFYSFNNLADCLQWGKLYTFVKLYTNTFINIKNIHYSAWLLTLLLDTLENVTNKIIILGICCSCPRASSLHAVDPQLINEHSISLFCLPCMHKSKKDKPSKLI